MSSPPVKHVRVSEFGFEMAKKGDVNLPCKVMHPNCTGSLCDHLLHTSKKFHPELVPRNFLERGIRALTMNYCLWIARPERESICAN